ncbi:hypothetical protein NC651_034248 [Populus alba x Populus x berolinensis]|nr:hypothetical protein NC651_034248 [Populus alba x Populus x berolinensis]
MVAYKDEELERKERELEQLSMGFVLFKEVHQHAQTDDQGIIQSLSNNKILLCCIRSQKNICVYLLKNKNTNLLIS